MPRRVESREILLLDKIDMSVYGLYTSDISHIDYSHNIAKCVRIVLVTVLHTYTLVFCFERELQFLYKEAVEREASCRDSQGRRQKREHRRDLRI